MNRRKQKINIGNLILVEFYFVVALVGTLSTNRYLIDTRKVDKMID